MALRIGPGPVFVYESLVLSRRAFGLRGPGAFCLHRVDRPGNGVV